MEGKDGEMDTEENATDCREIREKPTTTMTFGLYRVRESIDHSTKIILSRTVHSLGRSYK